MSDERALSSLFRPVQRYVRAVHLECDFDDASALQDYIVTEQVHEVTERITQGMNPASTQRAWRITGDYGSGKSSLALALAHILSRQARELPKNLKPYSKGKRPGPDDVRVLPVLLTGSREPLSRALLRRCVERLDQIPSRGREPGFLRDAREILQNSKSYSNGCCCCYHLQSSPRRCSW